MALNSRKFSRLYLCALVIGAGCVAYRTQFFAPEVTQRACSYMVYPLLYAQQLWVEPLKQWVAGRQDVQSLRGRIAELEQDCAHVRAENIALLSTLHYHKDVQELIDFQKRYNTPEGRTAQILTRVFSDAQHYYFVNLGERHGIEKDMVAVYGNCLVGRVEAVFPWYSKIRLVTDKACKVACHCVHTNAAGIYEGANNYSTAVVKYVSHLAEIHSEDMVLSSGEGLVFPRGFALGTIVRSACDNLYYSITVKPALNVHTLSYCTLVKKGEIEQHAARSQEENEQENEGFLAAADALSEKAIEG